MNLTKEAEKETEHNFFSRKEKKKWPLFKKILGNTIVGFSLLQLFFTWELLNQQGSIAEMQLKEGQEIYNKYALLKEGLLNNTYNKNYAISQFSILSNQTQMSNYLMSSMLIMIKNKEIKGEKIDKELFNSMKDILNNAKPFSRKNTINHNLSYCNSLNVVCRYFKYKLLEMPDYTKQKNDVQLYNLNHEEEYKKWFTEYVNILEKNQTANFKNEQLLQQYKIIERKNPGKLKIENLVK